MADSLKKGVIWVTISSLTRNLVTLLQIGILTRILDKSDFGIIAIATLFVSFTQLFLDMGISAGILHIKNITKKDYSSLFWLNIFFGVFLTSILFLISPYITDSYNSEELNNIVRLLCLSVFINSIGNQQRIVCQKKTLFKRIALIEITSAFIIFVTAVLTAVNDCGVYSLAYSTLAGSIFNNLTHLILRIKQEGGFLFHFSFYEVKPFLKIGIYSTGAQIIDFFTRELDIIIVSATLGIEFLGVYNVAKKLSLAIFRFISPVITNVITPLLANINEDKQKLKTSYCFVTQTIAVLAMPLYFLLVALSPTVMYVAFGVSFIDGAPIQSVFAIMYSFSTFLGICGSLQVATGRTDIGLLWTIISICSSALIYYITSLYGVTCFLFGILLKSLFDIVAIWKVQFKPMLGIGFMEYIKLFLMPFCISLILAIPIIVFDYTPSILRSIIYAIIFILIYFCTIYKSSNNIIITQLVSRLNKYK